MTSFNDSNTKQFQELVTCTICLEHYQDPRLLPCSHTFCLQCIDNEVKNDNFSCPFQDNMKINQNDIDQLPINRTAKDMVELLASINLSTEKKFSLECDNCNENQAVNWCDKCTFHLCQPCAKSIHSMKICQSHTTVSLLEKIQSFCIEHPDEKFKYWCKQCEVLVCHDCLLFEHKDHTFSSIKEATSEVKTKFQETAQEIDEIKRNLTKFSETTKYIMNQQHEIVCQGKQEVEQMFANVQRMLEERKLTIIKQLEDNELETIKILDQQKNTMDQHLNLTNVQELCIKKMLDSSDPIQILKFKSTLSHNYKNFTEQYKKIDEGYTIDSHTFEEKDKEVEQILEKISQLGNIKSESHAVNKDTIGIKMLPLDISKPDGETKLTGKIINRARGYKFSLKQLLRLHSIRIQTDYIGEHVGFVVNDADVVISNGTVNSNNSNMKWLTIPLKCDIQNNYSVLVWAPSGNGSYAYKEGDVQFREVDHNCAVESKCVTSAPETTIGSKISTIMNIYSIEMILNVEK